MKTSLYHEPEFQIRSRKLAACERRVADLEDVLTVSRNRDLQERTLETLNPRPPGVFAPDPGAVFTIHVDSMRIRANRVHNTRDPIIRILHKHDVWHCHAIRLLGPSEMAEDYDRRVPGRASAVCVLQTAHPIEVLR